MPEGNKVGDAYIEVTPELNVKKLLAQSNAAMEKLEARWAAQSSRIASKLTADHLDSLRSIERAKMASVDRLSKAQGRARSAQMSADRAAISKTTKFHIEETQKRAKATRTAFEAVQRRLARKAPDASPVAAKLPKSPTQSGGKRPGSLNRGSSFGNLTQNLLSVLPGQLEKIFMDPKVAAVAVGAAVALAGVFSVAFTGALGVAVGGGLLGGAAMLFAKTDAQFAELGKSAGQSMVNTLNASLGGLKPIVTGVMLEATNSINRIIMGIDLAPLKSIAAQVSSLFMRLEGPITHVINTLSTIGAQTMPALAGVTEQVVGAFSSLFDMIADDAENTNALINGIGLTVTGLVKVLEFSTAGVLGLTDATITASEGFTKFIDSGKNIPVVGALVDSLTGGPVRDLINGLNDTKSAADAAGNAPGLQSLGAKALAAAGGLTASAKAAEDAATQQKDLNAAIEKYNAHVLDVDKATLRFKDGQVDLKKAFKESKGALDERTQAGRDAKAQVIQQIEQAHELATAVFESTGSADKANAAFKRLTGQVKSNSGASAAAKSVIQEMISKYQAFAGTPNIKKSIVVNADGTENVEATLNHLARDRIARIITVNPMSGARVSNKPGQVSERANGGFVDGPGTSTSDSIPAMLSRGEFVIKASAAKKLGASALNQLNQGKMPIARANGGPTGSMRPGTASFARATRAAIEIGHLSQQVMILNKIVASTSKAAEQFRATLTDIRGSFNQFTNLASIDAEGKGAADIITELRQRRRTEELFARDVAALKARGLGTEGVQQLLDAGPDSPLARTLRQASKFDLGLINKSLADDTVAQKLAKAVDPKGASAASRNAAAAKQAKLLAARQARLSKVPGAMQQRAKAIKAEISHAHQVGFTAGQMRGTGLRSGMSFKLMIGDKEIKAIIREENAKAAKKGSTAMRRGR